MLLQQITVRRGASNVAGCSPCCNLCDVTDARRILQRGRHHMIFADGLDLILTHFPLRFLQYPRLGLTDLDKISIYTHISGHACSIGIVIFELSPC